MTALILGTLSLLSSLALAEFDVPSSVHTTTQLEKAKVEAKEKKKPIAFLYSDEKTTCPLCSDASAAALKEFKSKAVLVYVDTTNGDYKLLLRQVQQSTTAAASGKYIPKLTVFDADLNTHIATVPYSRDAGAREKSFREAGKLIRGYASAGTGSTSGSSGSSSSDSFFNKKVQ